MGTLWREGGTDQQLLYNWLRECNHMMIRGSLPRIYFRATYGSGGARSRKLQLQPPYNIVFISHLFFAVRNEDGC